MSSDDRGRTHFRDHIVSDLPKRGVIVKSFLIASKVNSTKYIRFERRTAR